MGRVIVWAAVGGLGGLAACARVLLDVETNRWLGRPFPFGTMAVNLSGAFALGVLVGADVAGDALLLAGTATLGSYTTFSTWMLESDRLLRLHRTPAAWCNLALSLLAGVGAVALGRVLGGIF
jgi:CrcB protein